jgi:uncharacterized protein
MDMTDDVVQALTDEEAWDFLGRQEFGRLAFHLASEVHITPVNFALHGRRIIVRTAEGSKLLGVVMNKDVAFEVDEITEDRATSVVVRGTAVHLRGSEADAAGALLKRSWVPTVKYEVVAVDVVEISGRSFRLDRVGDGDD